ncbi:MAG: type II toxin-antitoxin system RelE/ParE family toxin [Clostridiales bacterium]|nr:type II toxin-antitoxin system RelE/ParE family toxin [Clostridiales bacterium]
MNKWNVIYTEQAVQDLRDIYEYIAFNLLEPETAAKQVQRIMADITKLEMLPMRHQLYQRSPWKERGLRVLQTDNFLSFYLPLEQQNTVSVIRIMYGKRNVDAQL